MKTGLPRTRPAGESGILKQYLERIGYTGLTELSLKVLSEIHAAHLRVIAYENLDIHLGVEVSMERDRIVEKIVHRRRGGWCFEMNTLLAEVLEQIGFRVTRLGAAVNRVEGDDTTHLGHLVLRVDLDKPYLADAGFGNGFLYPLPFAEGVYEQGFLRHELSQSNGYWCYRNLNDGSGFDFTDQPRTLDEFAPQCHRLQTAPESGFVKVTVCQRFLDDRHVTLRGLVLKEMSAPGVSERDIDSRAEYGQLLTDTFGLELTKQQIDQLWTKAESSHQDWDDAGRP